ncbi:MAG: SRPBCC family protein [Myxococcaceae bacterium]
MVTGLLVVAAVIALFLVVAAVRPSAYRVERTLEIAPPERVFPLLSDVRLFSKVFVLFGAPLEKRDPQLQQTFEGQSFAWSGKEAGKGKLTIAETVPNQKVVVQLEFIEPMASKATLVLTLAGSSVTWAMEGHHNFIGRAAGVFMNLENMLAKDIEKSLEELKGVVASR